MGRRDGWIESGKLRTLQIALIDWEMKSRKVLSMVGLTWNRKDEEDDDAEEDEGGGE